MPQVGQWDREEERFCHMCCMMAESNVCVHTVQYEVGVLEGLGMRDAT